LAAATPTITSFTTSATAELPYSMPVTVTAVFPEGTGVVTPGNLQIVTGVALSVTPPGGQTVYTLTVTRNGVSSTRQLTIYVMPPLPPSLTSFGRSGNTWVTSTPRSRRAENPRSVIGFPFHSGVY
jgi:hypothetical protein